MIMMYPKPISDTEASLNRDQPTLKKIYSTLVRNTGALSVL